MSVLCRCGDEQDQHRRGTGGCREPECGCGRFEMAAAPEPVVLSELSVAAMFAEAQADADREVELAARLAEAEQELGETRRMVLSLCESDEAIRAELRVLHPDEDKVWPVDEIRALIADRDRLRADVDRLNALLSQAEDHFRHLQDEVLPAAVDEAYSVARAEANRLRAQLLAERAESSQELLAARTELANHRKRPAAEVLSAYDAWLCDRCGRRYTRETAAVDHACGPMHPVTVTISRRPAGDITTENRSTTE